MLTFTDKEREKAMNIGEHFYCSRCLSEIGDEGICPECGYDPESPADKSALEEGTVLGNMRFHVGAVRERLKIGYVYGAYDYEERKPACIFEYFPDISPGLERDEVSGSEVHADEFCRDDFERRKMSLVAALDGCGDVFEENNTVYIYPASFVVS